MMDCCAQALAFGDEIDHLLARPMLTTAEEIEAYLIDVGDLTTRLGEAIDAHIAEARAEALRRVRLIEPQIRDVAVEGERL